MSNAVARYARLRAAVLLAALWLAAGAASADPIVRLLTFQDSPDPIAATGQLTYTLQVSNTSLSTAADGVVLTVPVPAGLAFLSVDDAACTYSAPNVVCSFGTIQKEVDRVVRIFGRVTAPGGTSLSTTATATSTTPGESPSSLTQTTSITTGTDLELATVASPATVLAGAQVTLTHTASNLGPDAASGLRIVDTLPPNTTYVSASGTNWSCSASGSTVTCTRTGNLAVGASTTLAIVARVQSSLSGNLTNVATLSATTPDGVPGNDTASASFAVQQGADVAVSKTVSSAQLVAGAPASFTLRPRNTGPDAAATVTVTDVLPAGFTGIAASGTNWTCGVNAPARTVTCTRATLPVGATNDITISATAPDETVVPAGGLSSSNTATIAATTGDPVPGNNSGSVAFVVQRDGADLQVAKTKSPDPVAQGATVTSVLSATNRGPRALAGGDTITLVDTLAAGEDYSGPASFSNNGWSCAYAAPAFTCTRAGPLAVNATTPSLTLTTTATGSATLTNQGCVSIAGSRTDPNGGNDCTGASVSATSERADLRIEKAQSAAIVAAADASFTYTLTIVNDGPQDATGVVVTDVIPMRTTLAGGTGIAAVAGVGSKGSTGSCSVSGATVTCTYPTLRYAGGAPADSPETAVITITVQRPVADGAFTNSASVNSTDVGDPDRGDNASSVNTTVEPVADVRVQSYTITPASVRAGVDSTHVITVRNDGPSTAAGVTLVDEFDPAPGDGGYDVRSISATKGSCSFDAATDRVSCTIGSMAVNEVQTVTLAVRPAWMTSPPTPRTLPATATVATTTTDLNAANDVQAATLTVTPALIDLIANQLDVAATVGVTPDPFGYDGTNAAANVVAYRITVTNSGPSSATGVSYVNVYTPPAGATATFLCDSDSALACSGVAACSTPAGTSATGPATLDVNCTAGTLEAGQNVVRFLRYRIDTAPPAAGQTYSGTVTVSANETESNLANDSATEPTAVRAKADLQVVAKTAFVASPPLQYGQPFQWRIRVVNAGPGNAYDSVLNDALPAGMQLAQPFGYTVAPGAGTCTASSTTQFSCALGTLAPGAGDEQTVTVDVVIPRPASPPFPTTYTNVATVSTFSVDPVSANDSGSGTVSLVKSSIAGRVYRDHDNDGVVDPGETGISGVSLSLAGSDVFGNAVARTATSDGSGNFLFDNLEQSDATGYTITQTQPAGHEDGVETAGTAPTGAAPGGTVSATVGSNAISAIVLDKDQAATGYLFGELRQNALSGRVYADVDRDGTLDAGEPGIVGVAIALAGTDARGTAVNRNTTTNASGDWTFANVLPGTYTVTETQPTEYLDGAESVGSLGGSTAVNDEFTAIAVTGADGTNYRFAELAATVAGRVWRDVDRDGAIDAGEPGIAGVTLALSGTGALGGAVSRTTTTAADGTYRFADLPQGTYTVTQTQPAGYGSSTPNALTGVAVGAGATSGDHDFGETTASLAGLAFHDRDGDGVRDAGEPGIAGVTLALTGTSAGGATVNQSATTAADGSYAFLDLVAPNGSGYTLTQTQPAAYQNGTVTAGTAGGTASTAQNRVTGIAPAAGTDATGYAFAELGTAIGGFVYRDTARDGVRGAGDPGIAGVTLELRDATNAPIATTTTGADGSYAFPTQPAGSYTIVQTQPPGYASGPQNASDSVAFALVTGVAQAIDFGERAGSLAGRVFLDADDDGIPDAGEIGLPGVSITLTGTDAAGNAVSRAATTDAAGTFAFADLLGGTYAVAAAQPAAFGDGREVPGPGNVGGTVGNDVYSAIALAAGTDATGYNFGETGSAITGVAFRDANRDGVRQPGDVGIAGVTIALEALDGTMLETTTTAADGTYLFAGRPAGSYRVRETQPAGYGSASPDLVAVVVSAGGGASADFADTLSTLAGVVFVDLDGDGARDSGEAGLAGVALRLSGTDAAGAVLDRTAFTDATGAFTFVDVPAADSAGYGLTQVAQPAGYADGPETAGTAGGTASATPGADSIAGLALGAGLDATGYLYAERGIAIAGVVWRDDDASGTRESGEPGLGGVTLTLRDGLGAAVATTQTAADGSYAFGGLAAGQYTVEQTQPAGYGSSTPNSLSATLGAGASATLAFGESTSSLAGAVWVDADGDGARDAGEPGIAGVVLTLTGTDVAGGAVSRTATAGADGTFRFDGLLAGTYSLVQTQPAAYADGPDAAGTAGGTVANDRIDAIALPPGTAATGYAFAERGQSIGGRVYVDADRDGAADPDEPPLAGVTLRLLDASGALVATTNTDADGAFGFANVPAGRWTVSQVQPAGYGSSTPDDVVVELAADAATARVAYGETVGSLAGRVYHDADGDGTRDPTDPPIAGVVLTLSGVDARGLAVAATATTDRDGRYRFDGLAGGTYSIVQTQPDGYLDGPVAAGSAGGTIAGNAIVAIALGAQVDATGYDYAERGASGSIAGRVWLDADRDRRYGTGEGAAAGWIVELLQSGRLVQTVATGADGRYAFADVPPGAGYEVRFREPASRAVYGRPVTNEGGLAASAGVVGPANPGGADPRGGTLLGLVLEPGAALDGQSLPLAPTGVVYDSVARTPIAGATVTLVGPGGFDPARHLLGGEGNVRQTTGEAGLYQFQLLGDAPAGTYRLEVVPPPGRYLPGTSALVPPCAGALAVAAEPDPAIVQGAYGAPAIGVPNLDAAACPAGSAGLAAGGATTQWFLQFALVPGVSAPVLGNHVPIDPILGGALTVVKTTPLVNVSRGDLVPYSITVTNNLDALLTDVDVRDLLPPGFAYRAGSATVDGIAREPARAGRQLTWALQRFTARERRVYRLLLVVGAGVAEGEHVNQALALNGLIATPISNVATAAVRVVPDAVFDCTDVIGKVYDDDDGDGRQGPAERGLAGVRLATVNGVLATTDAHGRYHVPCAAIPDETRGSNFVLKLDPRTLPTGWRPTTENPGVARATRGKVVQLDFGAARHRRVRVDVADAAFVPGEARLRPEWAARLAESIVALQERPSVVRIAYAANGEAPALVTARTRAVAEALRERWRRLETRRPLEVEFEDEVQR